MKRVVRLAALAALVGVIGFGLAGPSQAAQASVTVYTAGARVSDYLYAPGLGAGKTVSFAFDTANAGIGGQKACVSAHNTAGAGTCALAASGTVTPGIGGLGGWCGYSAGTGFVTKSIVNGRDVLPKKGDGTSNLKLEWKQSAGTLLPTVFTLATTGQVVGFGASQTTGAKPGTCGVGGGTNEFATTGFSVLATP